jgi:hypothetical protein
LQEKIELAEESQEKQREKQIKTRDNNKETKTQRNKQTEQLALDKKMKTEKLFKINRRTIQGVMST